MLEGLPIALAQVKAHNTSENLQIKSNRLYILRVEQKKLLKRYIARPTIFTRPHFKHFEK